MAEYFNRLLSACDRRVVFAATVRLDSHVDQFKHEIGCRVETGIVGPMH